MLAVLSYESPFHQMAFKVLEKLLFVSEVNLSYDLVYSIKAKAAH